MGWSERNITSTFGTVQAALNPVAYFFAAQGTRHVVFEGINAGLPNREYYELYAGADDQWNQTRISDSIDAAPPGNDAPSAFMFDAEGSQHVLFRAALAGAPIWEFWWNDGWDDNNLSEKCGGAPPAASEPFGWQARSSSTQHVVYAAADGHVILFSRGLSGDWQPYVDLTQRFGAPLCVGAPGAYEFGADGTQHINYRGEEGHIWEVWSYGDGIWRPRDLSLAAGVPSDVDPLAGPYPGFGFAAGASQHIPFQATDFDVHQLRWHAGDWTHHNVTADSSAPKITGGITAYEFPAVPPLVPQATTHIMYSGSTGQVFELWSYDGLTWTSETLTQSGASPFAAGNRLAATVDTTNATQNVFYRSIDNDLIELRWTPQPELHLPGRHPRLT